MDHIVIQSYVNTTHLLNDSNLDNEAEINLSTAETVIVSILLACIIILTILGNITVLLAVYLDRRLRHTTNYFVVNLAGADLLLGITVLPLSATLEVLKYWPFGHVLCEIWASADVLWCTASILTLCVISIDRYIGVTRPLQHSSIITKRRAGLIIVFVWLLSGVISVGPLIGWRESQDKQTNECTVTKQIGYVLFSVAGSFYIPTLIIIIVYVIIYREATRHTKFLNSGSKTVKDGEDNGVTLRIHTARFSQAALTTYQGSSSSENSEGSIRKLSSRITPAGKLAKFKREKKAAKTLDVLCNSCHVPEKLFTVIFWLGYCNSLMNPIIYATSSREFKRAFLKVLRCYWIRIRFQNIDGEIIRKELHTRKMSTYSTYRRNSMYATVHVRSERNLSKTSREGESPVKSLLIYQENKRQKHCSSPTNNLNSVSRKSSYSDLMDYEYGLMQSNNIQCLPSNYSAMV
ncbi:alpha1-adrenergic receptor [Mactra antiquata]